MSLPPGARFWAWNAGATGALCIGGGIAVDGVSDTEPTLSFHRSLVFIAAVTIAFLCMWGAIQAVRDHQKDRQ